MPTPRREPTLDGEGARGAGGRVSSTDRSSRAGKEVGVATLVVEPRTADAGGGLAAPQHPRRGLVVFLLLAFGLAWAAQIALVLAARGTTGGMAAPGPGVMLVGAALMWPPAIGAYVARRWVERSGFADAGLRWPPRRLLLAAWLGPAALTVAAMLLSLPVYPFDPDLRSLEEAARAAGQPLPAAPWLVAASQIVFALTLAVPINALLAFGEEFGWRGYLLPRLIALCGPARGLVLHGAVWGAWHAPLIYLASYNYPGHPVLGVPLFVVTGALLGVLLGWLQLAGRSVVLPTIGHAAFNAIAGLPLLLLPGVDAAVGGVLWSPVGWLVLLGAIGLLARTGALGRALAMTSAGTRAG
jgi:membrane protease YdiL (CAAX protease family)